MSGERFQEFAPAPVPTMFAAATFMAMTDRYPFRFPRAHPVARALRRNARNLSVRLAVSTTLQAGEFKATPNHLGSNIALPFLTGCMIYSQQAF